jgi:hypothetical protein
LNVGACRITLDERPPDRGRSSSGLLEITWHRRRYRRSPRRRSPTVYALRQPDPQSIVVVGPHLPPRWVCERAIYTAAPVAYGEPVIHQTVGAMDMSGASV